MRQGFLDKFISRVEQLDASVVSAQLSKIAQERGFLETLFQSVDEGLMVIGEGCKLLYANHAAERMIGFTAEAQRGESMARWLREWGIEGMLLAQLPDWSRIETREVEVSYPEHRFISFYARPIESASGDTDMLLILRDVTRLRKAEASALADERLDAVKTLAAGVAHEIGNPLNALTIHLQLLKRELAHVADNEQRESLSELTEIATREVGRLDGILRRFLAAIRPTKPTLVKGDLAEVLQRTLAVLAADMEQRRIDFTETLPSNLPEVFLDGAQLEQVFFNLLKNAMDAVPDGGRIGLTATVDDGWVGVTIMDSGAGIPEELLGRIFDPYVTTKAKGNGLGLMIVKRIVEAHGGTIECASRIGEGTCFTIRLPRASRRVRAISSATTSEETK